MIGHRSPRYLRFGWAAARLDDLANWAPARLAGLAAAAWAPLLVAPPETRSSSCAATPAGIPARMQASSRLRLQARSTSGLADGTRTTAVSKIEASWVTADRS